MLALRTYEFNTPYVYPVVRGEAAWGDSGIIVEKYEHYTIASGGSV